jgi:hypothetical protein
MNTNATITDDKLQEHIDEYMNSLKRHEKAAYDIAVSQLESSFDITKSIGFMEYMNSKNK